MALKQFLKSLEDVDEGLRSLYASDGKGGFVLDIEGGPKDPRIDEFRENNRKLHTQVNELQEQLKPFQGLDIGLLDQVSKMQQQLAEEEEKKLLKAGNLDEIIKRRTMVAVQEANKQVGTLQQTLKEREATIGTMRERLGLVTIDQALDKELESTGVKVRSGALADVRRRARDTWRINDQGAMVPMDGEGKIRYGSDGNPLSMSEFLKKDLVESAGHLFEPAGGGGASGGQPGGGVQTGVRTIDGSDPLATGRHLKDIAEGKVKVVHKPQ